MSIDTKIAEYKKTIAEISEKRNRWNNDTKKGLIKILKALIAESGLDIGVYANEELENLQSVYLELHKSPSGIFKSKGGGGTNFVKNGGALLFSQSYNADVNIIILYPHVEEWVEPIAHKVLRILPPDQVTPELVAIFVEMFFEEMMYWEKSYDLKKAPIGFIK